MSSLKMSEKKVFERLFDGGGYVLDFSDKTYSEFFREYQINIDAQKYHINGPSKMKRLRAFWELDSDLIVGEVLNALLEYTQLVKTVADSDYKAAKQIINRLTGHLDNELNAELTEKEFLNQTFNRLDLSKLLLEPSFEKIINQRLNEIQKSLHSKIPLAAIFLCGSTLEGLLLNAAIQAPKSFNMAQAAQKDKDGKVRPLHDWTLENLINVAHELNLISLDTKNYAKTLQGFRNYIHPMQQARESFHPDEHTARISWQVLQATIADLSGKRKSN